MAVTLHVAGLFGIALSREVDGRSCDAVGCNARQSWPNPRKGMEGVLVTNPNSGGPQGPGAVLQMLQGAQVTAVLSAAIDLGVFAALATGPLPVDKVATRIESPARSTRILLDALVVLGLLTKDGASYILGPLAAAHLVPDRPGYVGAMANVVASPTMWTGISRLKEAVRAGGSVLEDHGETPRHPFWEVFAQSTVGMSAPAAAAIEGTLHDWIASKPSVRVLDVAAGSGTYGFTLAKNPNVQLASLDWPNVLVHTRKAGARFGVDASRVKYLEGDLFELNWAGPYDVVLLSQIYHHFDPETCLRLTQKAAGALAPGGKVVVQDFLSDDAVKNPAAAMFSVTMLVWTRSGEAYSLKDYEKWFGQTGLTRPKLHTFDGMPSSVLIADKT
ncbi:MAG: methyltransferase [Polyangiaceae bacterium]